jgi:hypothetical protein
MIARASGLLLIGVLLAACGAQPAATGRGAQATIAPAPTRAAAEGAPSVRTSESPAASELEGVWQTGVVTPDDAMAALQAAGLQQYAQGFFDFWKIGNENVFTLRIKGGRWACYRSKDGGLPVEDDSGAYTISGDTVTIQHGDQGADTHRWSVDGDTLTITYLSDTFDAPDFPHGEEVYQRVLYMSSPWTRQTP